MVDQRVNNIWCGRKTRLHIVRWQYSLCKMYVIKTSSSIWIKVTAWWMTSGVELESFAAFWSRCGNSASEVRSLADILILGWRTFINMPPERCGLAEFTKILFMNNLTFIYGLLYLLGLHEGKAMARGWSICVFFSLRTETQELRSSAQHRKPVPTLSYVIRFKADIIIYVSAYLMCGYTCQFADLIGCCVYVGVIETNIPVRSATCYRSNGECVSGEAARGILILFVQYYLLGF